MTPRKSEEPLENLWRPYAVEQPLQPRTPNQPNPNSQADRDRFRPNAGNGGPHADFGHFQADLRQRSMSF